MLSGMDIPPTGAGPWLVVAVALGIAGLALAAGVAVQAARRPRPAKPAPGIAPGPERFPDDDLADFLERPPGSAGRLVSAGSGWAALSGPGTTTAVVAPAETAAGSARRPGSLVPTAVVAALLLLAAAVSAGAAAAQRSDPGAGSGRAVRPASGAAADLTFGGVVLERRVVGVTATYPHVRLTREGAVEVAHVELPTWNCLADAAPADPVAAHCSRAMPEYAELRSPALSVTRSADGRLRISGRFPTSTHPNGSAPAPTGRAYRLVITVAPAGRGATGHKSAGHKGAGHRAAIGELRLGSDRALTTEVSVLSAGG